MASSRAKGTEYEALVRDLFEALHRADGIDTIDVKHDHVVTGRSGCDHQIDVFWSFTQAAQVRRVAVECKAFEGKPVSIGRLRDFYGVLSDVPDLHGIFVSLDGFQSGARRYADFYGIKLYEARPPRDADWEGRVRNIHNGIHVSVPTITDFKPLLAPDADPSLLGAAFTLDCDPGEPIVFDAGGRPRATYADLRDKIPLRETSATGLRLSVGTPGCIINNVDGTPIPIAGVELTYDMEVTSRTSVIRGDEVVRAIMRDVASGRLTVFDKDGTARTVGSD